jgi:hypothetical protein
MDDNNWWIWLVIAIAVIALVALIANVLRKRTSARAAERDRHRAGELREKAQVGSVEASRREAEAAAARADAEEARLAAEQREREAREHAEHAQHVRQEADAHLAEAEKIDPDKGRRDVREDPATHDVTPGDPATGEHVRDPRRDL